MCQAQCLCPRTDPSWHDLADATQNRPQSLESCSSVSPSNRLLQLLADKRRGASVDVSSLAYSIHSFCDVSPAAQRMLDDWAMFRKLGEEKEVAELADRLSLSALSVSGVCRRKYYYDYYDYNYYYL